MPEAVKRTLLKVKRHFRRVDPKLFAVLQKMEFESLRKDPDPATHFPQLAREIIYQQLAGKAAYAIHQRFLALFPNKRPTPSRVSAIPEGKLRAVGLSWAKARYIRDLAAKVQDRSVDLRKLHTFDDEATITELTEVKGIGRWTAEMFLMFTLGREDVFSHGDLGLRKGFERIYGKHRSRTQKNIEKITARWSPYRSYGSLALWHAMDSQKKPKKKTGKK